MVRPLIVTEPPVVDGEVLGDPAYEGAIPATDFWQTQPDAGAPSTERTEVYVVNTRSTLYFGVVCYDEEPDKIISTSSRRDSPLVDTDSFQIIIDTYRDQLTGFVFGTNPAGIEYDGQVTREGQGTFGSQGGFNLDWDGAWEVRTKVSDIGWTAEIAVPFRTIRFPQGRSQIWGLNFQRNIRRRIEISYWASLPLQFDLFRLSYAGTLNNLEIPRQQNLKLVPFVLGSGQQEGIEDAEVVPIDGGLRLSGKAGHYSVGLLHMGAGEVEDVAPTNRFSVARLGRDLPDRAFIGGILINRTASGEFALQPDDENWTYGLDGRWGIGQFGTVEGFVAQTRTPGTEEDEYAFRLAGQYDSQLWSMSAGYDEVAEGFNPEVGFLSRRGYRKPSGFVLRRIRPQNMGKIFELRPHVSYRGFWDFDGFQETGFLHIDNHWEFRNGAGIHIGINFTQEGLTEPFEISEGILVPIGTYKNSEVQLVSFTNDPLL